jgi:Domain of unknown function (DUF4091)
VLRVAALVAATLLAPAAAVAPDRARELGAATSLEKLRPGDPLPPRSAIDLAAARGECESAQVAVRPARPVAALTASAPPLDGPSRIAPVLYREEDVDLVRPSGPQGAPGPWPDALVPERDAYVGEARRAFPVAAPAGALTAIWVEVCVPEEARPGLYRGSVRVSDGARPIGSVPIELRVWPFALPRTGSVVVTFGLPTRLGTKVLGKPDDPGVARLLAAAALRHRVSPHGLSYDPPPGTCTASRCELDWSAYDAEMAPILDGTLVPGVRGLFADARISERDWQRPDADVAALFRAWREHFERRGWADRLWLYTLDEPKPAQLPDLARRARVAHLGGVRVFATTLPAPALAGLVDAFAPVVNSFEGRGHDDFAVRPARFGPEPGRPFWYTSCMSHGCDELPERGATRREMLRLFDGWPGYEIDRPGASARAMGWLGWRHRVAGELYYTMLESWQRRDPWKDVRAFAGNGDGTFLYPGLPQRLGGEHPFPVESIRLKLVRDAIEDRELLELAERSGLGALAARLAGDVAPSLRGFAREPSRWVDAHRRLGDALAASFAR